MQLQDSIQTVSKQIKTLSNNEAVAVYKEILNSQTDTYNLIFVVFFGILAIFTGATWLYNKKIVKKEIEKITAEIYKKEKKKIHKKLKKKFEKQLYEIKGDNARTFAIRTSNYKRTSSYLNSFGWWLSAIKWYLLSKNDKFVRIGVDEAIRVIKLIIENEEEALKYFRENHLEHKEKHLTNINSIPEILQVEKKELLKLTEGFFSKL